MSFTQFSCPSCNVVLRVADTTPANTVIRCPKCGERFCTPAPAEPNNRVITSTEAKTLPRAPRSLATITEDDGALLRKIHRPAPRSRMGLWMLLGSLAAGVLLIVGGAGVGVAVWLRRSASQPAPPPLVEFVPPPANPPPAPFAPPAGVPAPRARTAFQWFNIGNRLRQQGDLDGAIDAFTRAIELNPRFAAAYCNRGLTRSDKRDFDGAIADATRSIELNPNDPFPFINRANARIQKGIDPEASIADASRALELRPRIPAALLNLGMARDQKGDYDGAIAEFDKALRLLPTFVLAYGQRGQTWMKKKQWDKAEADFTHILERNFLRPDIYQRRAICRAMQGNGEGAIADFSAALEIDPTNVTAYLMRGWFHLSAARDDEAAKDADTGLKLAGRRHAHAPYLAILAHCARRRLHPDEARRAVADALSEYGKTKWPGPVLRYLHADISAEELLRVAADNDQKTEAHGYVGVVLWLAGDDAKAREQLQWVRDNGNRTFVEYDLAVLLLHRLEKTAARKP